MILASSSLPPAFVYPLRPLLGASSSLTLLLLAIAEVELAIVTGPLTDSIPGLLVVVVAVVVVAVMSWVVIHDGKSTCLSTL